LGPFFVLFGIYNMMSLKEHIRKVLREENDRIEKLIRKYVNEMGLNETSKMMGITMTKIAEISNMPIDSESANELLLENMRLKKLKREYKEFDIRPTGDGIFYWGASTNTGHFLPDMIESIAVVATPFWDGEEWTPVELDWYTLLDGDGKAIIEISSDGSYYRQLKHQTHFNSVKELFNWYEEYYLPTVYDVIMNEILRNVHQQVDDELDNRGGYK
jgi:antitoxin component of RelBE/YafQ-DinJ toxin-antitoxin module